MTMKAKPLTIGKIAEATGVHLETIRYYERIGLMPKPQRTSGGYRSYDDDHLNRLSFIRRARELGFGIAQVNALLALAEPAQASCAEVKSLTISHLEVVRAKIDDLKKLELILARTVEQCSGRAVPVCPVVNMLNHG